MKKKNKKVANIKQKKAQKRAKSDRGRVNAKKEKLNMKANNVKKYKEMVMEKYLEMVTKQFEGGQGA